jgi:4-amino-4-deoxy-L-arabinose transferase-like glycosyltransferase
MRDWWRRLRPRQRWGGALALLGAGLTVLLAFLGNRSEPPAASTQALIALLAIMAQVGSAWSFSGDGKADPGLARRSVGRLVALAARAEGARQVTEALRERGATASEMKQAVGQLSVHLSYIEEGYLDAIEDWRVFHPDAVKKAERKQEIDG